jgi:dipeptidase D
MENIEPKEVFSFFKTISKIPRCSKQEKNISDYLVTFAKKRNLEVYQDEMLNVIIKKEATRGYEKAPTLILQGHMDMVCEKNANVSHDFNQEALKLFIEEDFLKAKGTTLGADNGIAVAFCLALLDAKDISHPPLEILLTTQEEIGLIGAANLDTTPLKGKYLINIDAEEEGVLFVSCAGGARSRLDLPIFWQDSPKTHSCYIINIKGLKGGHSGMDIDKNRANANKLLARTINSLSSMFDIYVSFLQGGLKPNAIPREAKLEILAPESLYEEITKTLKTLENTFKNEYKSMEPNLFIGIEKQNTIPKKVFTKKSLEDINNLCCLMPNGIQSMSTSIEGLVQSSTNLGVIQTNKNSVTFINANRSSVESLKEDILQQIKTIAKICKASLHVEGNYPSWEYKKESLLREKFISIYEKLYNKTPQISAIHAGLECGLLGKALKDIDMIAFGPNMYDVHTPDERLSISSTKRTWNYLCEILKNFNSLADV